MCVANTQTEETNEEKQKLDSTPPEIYCTVVCGFMCSNFFIGQLANLSHETSGFGVFVLCMIELCRGFMELFCVSSPATVMTPLKPLPQATGKRALQHRT